jgi:hypothetical protein
LTLRAVASTYRTFRNVPEQEKAWTSIDDDALEQAFAQIKEAESVINNVDAEFERALPAAEPGRTFVVRPVAVLKVTDGLGVHLDVHEPLIWAPGEQFYLVKKEKR